MAWDLLVSLGEDGILMQFGVALPHFGPAASPGAIVEVAQEAERLGFDSVWVLDRLLWPLQPTSRYPGSPGGDMPTVMQNTYDPFTVLAFVAPQTRRVRLGTSILVASYRSPLVVAKMGATLDVISEGRLILGIGAGWNSDEFTASGQSLDDRDEQADEFLLVIKELWTADQPEFAGKYYHVPRSIVLPKPLQKPHPPIWIGGNSRRAIRRAAELGDGWHPTSRIGPLRLAEQMEHLRALAQKAGRDPGAIAATLRWNAVPGLTDGFAVNEMALKLRQYKEVGVQHVCFDYNIPQPTSLQAMFKGMERLMHEVIPKI